MRNSKIAAVLLKQGAAAGLLLFEIADIMSRNNLERPSDLEEAVARAQAMAKAFLKSPRARGLLNAEMNHRHGDSSTPMLSPPRRHRRKKVTLVVPVKVKRIPYQPLIVTVIIKHRPQYVNRWMELR